MYMCEMSCLKGVNVLMVINIRKHPQSPTHSVILFILQARLDILRIHSRKMNLTRGINLRKIAEAMPGASGAEIKGVCTEAGMYALRERRVHVTQEDFEMAVAKVSVAMITVYIGFSAYLSLTQIMQKDSEKNMSIKKLWK